jgi:hypothetical protein
MCDGRTAEEVKVLNDSHLLVVFGTADIAGTAKEYFQKGKKYYKF